MPSRLVEIVIDTADPAGLARWWATALGWEIGSADAEEAYVVPSAGPPGIPLVFGLTAEPKAGPNRVRLALPARPGLPAGDPDGNEISLREPREEDGTDTGPVTAIECDALDPAGLAAFWSAASGWAVDEATSTADRVRLRAPLGTGPWLEFVRTAAPHAYKNRWHLDVAGRAADDRDAEVARLLALGAEPCDIGQDEDPLVTWVVLADPEGNEFCVLRSRD